MTMSVEAQVMRYIDNVLKNDTLEEVFNCFIIHSQEMQEYKERTYQEDIRTLFSNIPQDGVEVALKHYVAVVATLSNHRQKQTLLYLLHHAVTSNVVQAKPVCDALLSTEKFTYTNEEYWCQALALIRKIISGIDYKGVRDLLKVIFGKALSIPSSVNVSVMRQLNALTDVIEHSLDRNAALLPSYLILDDVQKRSLPKGKWPHWKFAKLVANFIDSFQPCAQMVTIVGRSKLQPVVGHSGTGCSIWKLDPVTAKFTMKGQLPYSSEVQKPQNDLLRYVLEQPYSREMVCSMLGLSKQQKHRCPVLEEQLVELIVVAMEKSEADAEGLEDGGPIQLFWQNLSSQLIYFVLFQYASFPHMVLALHDKLVGRNLRKGRDHLMWVLLQFISGSIQKNPLNDFLPVMKLYDLLYPEKEPLPFPDVNKPHCTRVLAITSIWVHLMRKAQQEKVRLQRPLPQALQTHLEYLQQWFVTNQSTMNFGNDYWISLLCNAYSTNQDYFTRPMGVLVEAIQGNQRSQSSMSSSSSGQNNPTHPLGMNVLDSLTVHTKMSLIHNVVTHVMKMAPAKSSISLTPALVETYSRLLVYNEIESLGIKGFISHLLPTVFRQQAWGILHTLLEMFSYRLHHIQPHYRVQLLSHLHSLAAVPQTNQTQLHLCVESTALKLITGLGSAEVQPQLSRFQNEPKSMLSSESEELNKALILTLARAIHVTGSESLSMTWCKEILTTIMQNTPHSWSGQTLSSFPKSLNEFFNQHQAQRENKAQLKRSVEEEYRKWKTMSNENDIIAHFSQQGTPHLFLCLLWKMLLENDRISPLAYKILDRIGARALSSHLRTFADFLVFEVSNSVGGQHVNKCIDALNDLIWKCHVISLDRLILCLALRSFEGNEIQVCFFIIQMLLIRPSEFKNRVSDFVKDNSPEHWKQTDWHEKHLAFHRKYPEKFYFEGLQDLSSQSQQHTYLPVYFGNICLRFLPVMDIVIHRFLELYPVATISVESLLDHLGCLYKFHDRPLTYLYNTLHYYEQKLKDRPPLKKKLVASITGALQDIRSENWALSEAYSSYLQRPPEDTSWVPELDYYISLVRRMADTMAGKSPFPHMDWRFNEFPNPAAHALHVTCIELMSLPVSAAVVGNNLLDVVLKGHTALPRSGIENWMNAIGLILTALPESYWAVLNDRILTMLQGPGLASSGQNIFQLLNFSSNHNSITEVQCCYLMALVHAVWYHASIGQISQIPQLIHERLKPVIKTEEQFLFLCHLVAPFFQRIVTERTRCVMDITKELYEILENVDKNCEQLNYMDQITDLFYHIKYMFTGDSVKADVERTIRNLRPALQLRLRFITHLNIEEVNVT
ncbi:mediator of RNA polymerase II transcription subunit 23-like isoform X1 [Ornithodoros turicata]|uniref:mediator of RNA polymerase II transcription subunit 23-like isoform X1 n=1 Tax=Ornithodoros turicata TaxID=34597 RepID=UPI0031390D70